MNNNTKKLRDLNKYIQDIESLIQITKNFKSQKDLIEPFQEIEILKLELQLRNVQDYLLKDESEVRPQLAILKDSPINPYIHDAFEDPQSYSNNSSASHTPLTGSPPPTHNRSSAINIGNSRRKSSTSSSYESKSPFANIAAKFGHIEPEGEIPSLSCRSEPQSPRRHKSTSGIRRSNSRRGGMFSPEAIMRSLRSSGGNNEGEKDKKRSLNKRSKSARQSREKEKTPWEVVDQMNKNMQEIKKLVQFHEDSLGTINQMLK